MAILRFYENNPVVLHLINNLYPAANPNFFEKLFKCKVLVSLLNCDFFGSLS